MGAGHLVRDIAVSGRHPRDRRDASLGDLRDELLEGIGAVTGRLEA